MNVLDSIKSGQMDEPHDGTQRYLAFKSGFISLQERLGELMSRQQQQQQDRLASDRSDAKVSGGQFATLQEFFQSKSSLRKQLEQDNELKANRRPKVAIMKLSKDDWNVKCWEDRLGSYRGRKNNKRAEHRHGLKSANHTVGESAGNDDDNDDQPNRLKKPERQVQVFHGRIEDVASKLDKVREGLPQDELIVRLERAKICDRKTTHSYTDLLKRELADGAHSRAKLMSTPTTDSARSPLGRPIRRISQDDDDGDDGDR